MAKEKVNRLEEKLREEFNCIPEGGNDEAWISNVMAEVRGGAQKHDSWENCISIKALWRVAGLAASIALLLIVLAVFQAPEAEEVASRSVMYDPMALLTLSLFGI